MKRIQKILALAAVGGLLFAGCSTQVTSDTPTHVLQPILADSVPATQPAVQAQSALPPGHPDLSKLQQQGGSPALPPGHPQLPSAAGGQGALPPGHPRIDSLNATNGPSTQPSVKGTLTIHAVQKTPGAAPAGADPVAIEIYVNDQLWDQSSAQLAADGTLKLVGLPAQAALQPLVKVTHAGTVFTAVGDVIDAEHPDQSLDVPIYETTEKAPDWSILMRHVIVHPSTSGVEVTEMLAIQSPGDRAWIGNADKAGKRTTLSLQLPDGAKDIKTGGSLGPDSIAFEGGTLRTSQALIPGENKFQLQYTIPASNGKVTLAVSAAVRMGHVMMFVPDDGTTVTPVAPLQLMGSQQMGESGVKTRYFMAVQVPAGQKLYMTVSDLNSVRAADIAAPVADVAAPAVAQVAIPAKTSEVPKMLAVAGSACVLAIGALFLMKPRTIVAKRK